MADSAKRLKTSEPATEQLKLPFGMLKAWDRLPSEWNPTGIVDLKVQDGYVNMYNTVLATWALSLC
jgi:hypothetical protein